MSSLPLDQLLTSETEFITSQKNEERSDLDKAKELREENPYLDRVKKVEELAKKLADTQEFGNVVRRSLLNLTEDTFRMGNIADLVSISKKNVEKDGMEREQEFIEPSEKFRSAFMKSPIFSYLKRTIQDEEVRVKVIDLLIQKSAEYSYVANQIDDVNTDLSGQTRISIENYLNEAVEEALRISGRYLPNGLSFREVPMFLNQAQVEMETALEGETRYQSLLNWVVQTARQVRHEGLRIFETPETQVLIAQLERIADQKNGLGGAILFGPPGTGKTELLVEKNKRKGFDSRVISIHHFTDYVQLLGEKPIPIQVDRATSYLERLTMVKDSLASMSDQEKLRFVQSKFSEGEESWQHFLSLVDGGERFQQLKTIGDKQADEVVNALVTKINNNIIYIGLGLQEGLTEEVAWARGEMIQAWDNNQMPILDEMDKGSEHSLEGISRLLNMSPGQKIFLGEKSYTIPSWAGVDGTANAMNLAPFLHDRFSPNVIYVDYPSPEDTLQKALVWLSDEQGRLQIDQELQKQIVPIFLYIFPEIQLLYPDQIEHPLSNRGIRKFCQMVSHGMDIQKALYEVLLKPGALSTDEKGRNAIQEVLNRFPTLVSPSINMPARSESYDVFTSPLYSAVSETFHPYDATKGERGRVHLSESQRQFLQQTNRNTLLASENRMITVLGSTISIESSPSRGACLAIRIEGKLVTKMWKTKDFELDEANSKILTADNKGRHVVVKNGSKAQIIDLVKGTSSKSNEVTDATQLTLSSDGSFLAMLQPESGFSLTTIDTKRSINFIDEDGDALKVTRFQFSPDSKYLLLETLSRDTFVIDVSRIGDRQSVIALNEPFFTERQGASTSWSIGNGNILFHPQSDQGYVLKS